MIAYLLYNLLLLLMLPVITVFLLWRVLISGESRQAWREQLGFLPKSVCKEPGRRRVWLHAVSVGEAVASASVVTEIKKALPNTEIVLSTTTKTGQNMARKCVEADRFIYFPWDLPFAVKGAVDMIRPDVYASVETEIWPNLLLILGLRNIPAAIVNGIISDRTMRQSLPVRPLYREALANVKVFCMQSEQDAERIVQLGASPDRVFVTGNTKFDQAVSILPEEERIKLAREFGIFAGEMVFVAGSTNPGEEEPVLEAFRFIRERLGRCFGNSFPKRTNVKLILAPRQIERGARIAEMCVSKGFSCGRRSAFGELTGGKDIAILDTLGELATVYALGDATFVGGTFIRKGGHNILQPIAQGKAVFYGPHTFKINDLVRIAEAGGVGFGVGNGQDLGERVLELLSDPNRTEEIRRRSLKLIESNRGASSRCAEAVAKLVAHD